MNKSFLLIFALAVSSHAAITTVNSVLRGKGCATSGVKGLSQQLIEQINCLSPGTMKNIAGIKGLSFGASAFAYLQEPAADALERAVAASGATISINSALRSLPQQYLLYKWHALGMCGIPAAAAPGRSNHNGGIAIDINSYSSWISRLKPYKWQWFGNGDKVHFTYMGTGTKDIRALSTKAFQMLWNYNNPSDTISVDGDFGPATERKLLISPAGGFDSTGCVQVKRFNEMLESNHTLRSISERQSDYGDCTTRSGVAGQCIDSSSCSGTTYSGLCPGPNNIKCCVISFTPTPTPPSPVPSPSGGGPFSTNANGIALIQSFEGFYPNFYKDPIGIRTIGFGHACTVSDCNNLQGKRTDGSFYRCTAPLSREEANDLLRGDLDNLGFEDCVNNYVTRSSLTSNQFSALISFSFNLGCGAFKKSTLLKRVNAGASLESIRAAFLMWNKAGGKVLPGLTRRRNAEADLYGGKLTVNSRHEGRDIQFDPNGSGVGAECWHYGEKGVCLPTAYCSGFSVAGLCPGAADVQCCLRKKCDATSEGSQDGQCGLASACSGTVVETANCTGATDLKCCKGSIPEPTTTCPDGATWSTTNRWCQVGNEYALGPFTRAMLSKCSATGGGDEICVQKYPFTWNGESTLLFRWPLDFALKIRGDEPCMLGSAPNNNYLGYCLESINVLSDTEANGTVVVSQRNVYGAMHADLQEACQQFSGGLACNTPRYDGDFFRTLSQSFFLSIVPTEEGGETEDNSTTPSSLDTTSNVWVSSQWSLSAEHEAADEEVSGATKAILCVSSIVAMLALF